MSNSELFLNKIKTKYTSIIHKKFNDFNYLTTLYNFTINIPDSEKKNTRYGVILSHSLERA